MIKRIKLTQQDMTTYKGFKWTVGEWKETYGKGELCGPGWLHCYKTPHLAVLHNPIHAHIDDPLGWMVDVDGRCRQDGMLKEGWSRMRLLGRVELPAVTTTQRIAYGILCAMEVATNEPWKRWAHRWLNGEDRTPEAAVYTWNLIMHGCKECSRAEVRALFMPSEAEEEKLVANTAAWTVEFAVDDKPLDLIALAEKAMAYK